MKRAFSSFATKLQVGVLLGLIWGSSAAAATPLYLDVTPASAAASPLTVYAGRETGFLLTLSSSATPGLLLNADLIALADATGAPVYLHRPLMASPTGNSRTGVQRFSFNVPFPASKSSQTYLLRLQVGSEGGKNWLPLPPVTVLAVNPTLPETLRNFCHQIPCGRLAGSAGVGQWLQGNKVELTEATPDALAGDPSVRVWFAETGSEPMELPEISRSALWIIFKPGIKDSPEIRRTVGGHALCVLVDSRYLEGGEPSALAQEQLERILATARALVLDESPSP